MIRRLAQGIRLCVSLLTIFTMLVSPVMEAAPVSAQSPEGYQIFASGLNGPFGEAFDASGNLYVAQGGGNGPSVARIRPSGEKETLIAGRKGAAGVAFSASGVLYLSDDLNTVTRVSGDYLEVVVPADGPQRNPNAIAFDQANNLYVLSAEGFLSKLTAEGVLITAQLVNGLNMPQGIAIDNAAQVAYISDATGSITRLDLETGQSELWLEMNETSDGGLALDAQGDLYLSLDSTNRVVKIDHVSKAITTCVDNIDFPRGLAFDAAGSLYVTDYTFGLVWKVDACGVTLPTQTELPVYAEFPTVMVPPDTGWVSLNDFTPNSQVNLTVFNPDGSTAYTLQFQTPSDRSFGIFFRPDNGTIQLSDGMTIQVEDVAAGVVKRVRLDPLSVDGIQYATKRIWGTGPANVQVRVQVDTTSGVQGSYETTADAGGAWTLELPPTVELAPGIHTVWAEIIDLDADSVHASYSQPDLRSNLTDDWIQLNQYPANDTVTITVSSAAQETLFSGVYNTDQNGFVNISRHDHKVDLIPGMVVTAVGTKYPVQRSITLPNLTLQSVDPVLDRVVGTASPGLQLVVEVSGVDYYHKLPVTVGSDGAWMLDAAQYSVDLQEDGSAIANYYDDDGDVASANLPPRPYIHASLAHDWINGSNFANNGSVNVTVHDAQNQPVYGPAAHPTDQWGSFYINPFDTQLNLIPGMRITVEDPVLQVTKQLILENLTIDTIDPEQDTIAGTALPNRTVSVSGGNAQAGYGMSVTSDENGNWLADFKTVFFDITPDMSFNAQAEDADGDATVTAPPVPLQIWASISGDWINLYNFSPLGMATLRVSGKTLQKQADPFGTAEFSSGEIDLDLTPGMAVEAEDQETGRLVEMTIANITVDPVDFEQDRVTGTAPKGAEIYVSAGDSHGSQEINLTASETDGRWQADFNQIGVNLTYNMWINARVGDDQGNMTYAEPAARTYIEASPVFDGINLHGFPPDNQATVSITSPGGDVLFQGVVDIDEYGEGWIGSDHTQVDLTPAMQIRVSAPPVLRELALPDISHGEVDPEAEVVRGTAEPFMPLLVTVYGDYGGDLWTQADASGHWTADFSELGLDLTPETWVNIRYYDEDGDSVYVDPPPYPHLDMWLDSNSVSAYDWPIGASLTLTIVDPLDGTYTDTQVNGRAPWSPGSGFYQFFLDDAFTLKPGQQVTVTDGTIKRTSTVANLLPPTIDAQNGLISGTAEEGAVIWINLCNQDGCAYRSVTAGSDGTYRIDFSVPGPNPGEEQTLHLYPGDGASINWADGTGNNTSLDWHIWNPTINANPLGRWVHARDWPKGTLLTLKKNGVIVGSALMDQAPWNPGDRFDIVAPFDLPTPLQPGDVLEVSDAGGIGSRTLVVSPLAVTQVNAQDRTISGAGKPGEWLEVCVNVPGGCVNRYVQAGQDGLWTANFAVEDEHNQGNGTIEQFQPGMNGWAADWDEDGDRTWADWRVWGPSITANPGARWLHARDWPKGETLTLKVNGVAQGTAVMDQAPWNRDDPNDTVAIFENVTMQAGDEVVVSNPDGTLSASLVLSPLQVTEVNLANSTVSGSTTPEAWVRVCANLPDDCISRYVQADEEGRWTASFATAGPGDSDTRTMQFQMGVSGWANDWDADGDETNVDWLVATPFISANVKGRWVQSINWAKDTRVYLKINGVPAGSVVVEPAPWTPADPDDYIGFFWLDASTPLEVGDTVTISNADGSISSSLTITPIEITHIDQPAAQITGVAEPGIRLEVCIHGPQGCLTRNIFADMDGAWMADFSVPGTEKGDYGVISAIESGASGWINAYDAEGDWTSIDWATPNPHMDVWLSDNAIASYEWPIGASLTLTVSGPAGVLYTETQTTGPAPWDPAIGFYYFSLPDTFQLAPGQQVTITDGETTRTTTIRNLGRPVVDIENSRITGTAEEGAYIWSCLDLPSGCIPRSFTVGASGTYTLDFGVPGPKPEEQETHTFRVGDSGSVNWSDDQGNNTSYAWSVPNYALHVNLHDQEVHGHDWPLGVRIDLTLEDPDTGARSTAYQVVLDPEGQCGTPCFLMSNYGWTLEEGHIVTMSYGGLTKTVTVSSLEITMVDALHDRLAGVADPGSDIVVNIWSQGGISRSTQADASGNWAVDFSVPGVLEWEQETADITASDNGRVLQLNPGGNNDDGTLQHWTVSAPMQLSVTSIDENIAGGSAIGTFSPVYPEPGQALVYSLVAGAGDADNDAFTINGNVLSIKAAPDFEAKASYSIRVRVEDSNAPGSYFEQAYTITVNDLNEAPTAILLSKTSIDENVAAGSVVGRFSVEDPDPIHQAFIYSLVPGVGSEDNAAFTVTQDQLSINSSPDFETKSTYSIRVRVTNLGSPTTMLEESFTITINNLNERATDIQLSSASIDENAPANSTIGELSATGADEGQTFVFSLVPGAGDADNGAFTISGNALHIKASPDYETKSSYSIRVRATDSQDATLTTEKAFTITVNNLNEAPTNITLSAASLQENVPAGSAVGTFTTTDPEPGQSYTYTLVSGAGSTDNASFTIQGSTLIINTAPDYETKASYSIRVRSTESGENGLWVERAFTITIIDGNDAPTALNLSVGSVNENVSAGTTVGTFSAVDVDVPAQTFTYSLVAGAGDTDNAAFTISGNTLRIHVIPDYETKASYSIRVRVTDSGSPAMSFERAFTITVKDVNEPPSSLTLSSSTIVENAPVGARAIGDFSAVDPDIPAQTFTYSLVYGSGSADNAAFTIEGSTLTMKAAPDYETKDSYTIRVRVTDSGEPSQYLEQVFTVTVTNQVEPPLVTSFNKSGLQDTPLLFTAANFSEHFIDLEASGEGVLEKIRITALPKHGTLRVGSGPNLSVNSEVMAADLDQLVYVPAANYSGSDVFSWNGADASGYATSSAQVFLNIGFVARYGFMVSPAGDAKSAKAGTTAAYTLSLTNTGNVADSYSVALVGSPQWATTFTPAQVNSLAAGAQAHLTVNVAIPANASGSSQAVLKITSKTDASKTVTVTLTTTAIAAPAAPVPVLLGVSPASANASALQGVRLTLTGAYFTDPMTVSVGGLAATSVTRESSVELSALLPTSLQPGVYAVKVCNASAKCASLPDAFTVLDNTPMVSGIYPNQGYNDTSNSILIQGYNLTASTTLTLAGAAPENQPTGIKAISGQLQATIPAGLAAGTYDVQVCNGTRCFTLVNGYTALDVIKNDFSASDEDLWTSPATVREGNTVTLGLNVHRLSGMGLSAAEVAFYVNDPGVPANKISPAANPVTSMMAPGSVEAVTTKWTPAGLAGAVKIYAVIDPDGLLTEATKANNIVSTTIVVLPREANDETAPVIHSLAINNGAASTALKQVRLDLQAVDNVGGTGVKTMNVVERVYNTSARQWVVVQETGWIPYQASYTMTLSGQGGIHYVQAWVADGAGNTSEMAQASINYEPPQDTVSMGQVRVYRVELTAGQAQHIALETLKGDADLYVWDPDGNLVAASISVAAIDRVDFTPRVSGVYQVEVYGYQDSTYTIDFKATAAGGSEIRDASTLLTTLGKQARTLPTIMTQNEPLKNIPTVSAPIIPEPDEKMIYLPIILK